jgi:hypothetical protein
MRFAAFLIVLAVALGAFLVLRSPSSDSPGIAPDRSETPVSEAPRASVELVRGERAPIASEPATPVVPPAPKTQPPSGDSSAESLKMRAKGQEPPPGDGIEALPNEDPGSDDIALAQKYERTTTEQRQQAIVSIQQLFESTPNLDPNEVVLLKHEIEWLQRSLDS